MQYRRYIPPPPLAAYVSCLWYSEGLQGTHTRERLLPNGESGIVFDLRQTSRALTVSALDPSQRCEDAIYAPAVFCGARTDSFLLDTSEQERVAGIQFHAGGAFPFLGLPACEVANATFDLADIWPMRSAIIREQLLAAIDVDDMFSILEKMLIAMLQKGPLLHGAVAFAARKLSRPTSTIRIQEVTDQIGISSRHFKELFRQQTGLTPKAFQRVRRFQHVLQTMRNRTAQQGADLAADCGYYDQAHFIHDFKHFSGLTPGEYLTIATPHLNHIPLK
jgi:AraC-like DNA-binding protein